MAKAKAKRAKASPTCRKHGQTVVGGRTKKARTAGGVGLNRCRWGKPAAKKAAPKRKAKKNHRYVSGTGHYAPLSATEIHPVPNTLRRTMPQDELDRRVADMEARMAGRHVPHAPAYQYGPPTKRNHHGGYHAPGDPLGYKANPRAMRVVFVGSREYPANTEKQREMARAALRRINFPWAAVYESLPGQALRRTSDVVESNQRVPRANPPRAKKSLTSVTVADRSTGRSWSIARRANESEREFSLRIEDQFPSWAAGTERFALKYNRTTL